MNEIDSLTISLAIYDAISILGMLLFANLLIQKRELKYTILTLGWLAMATGSAFGVYTYIVKGVIENYFFNLFIGLGTFLLVCGAFLYFNAIGLRFIIVGSILIFAYSLLPLFNVDLGPGPTPGILIQVLASFFLTFVAIFKRKTLWDIARSSYFWLVALALISNGLSIAFAAGIVNLRNLDLGYAVGSIILIVAIILYLHIDYGLSSRQIRESESRYRFLFEFAPVALWEIDISALLKGYARLRENGVSDIRRYLADNPARLEDIFHYVQVVDINQETLALHRAPSKQALIDSLDDIYFPDSFRVYSQAAIAFFEGKTEYETETVVHTSNGDTTHVILRINASSVSEKSPRALVSLSDITKPKRAEEAIKEYSEKLEGTVAERTQALQQVQERLLRQEKLAFLGQLAGSLGHELRNPLGAINNGVYLLDLVLEQPTPDAQQAIDIIRHELDVANRIIESLLRFAHSRSSKKEPQDLNALIREALAREAATHYVDVSEQLATSLPVIQADGDQLLQVFSNLVKNAIQAMPQGGLLQVCTEAPDPGWVSVSIRDTGEGISAENLDKIFEPLFTTKAKGIGLGLALVNELVKGHDGEISVESQEGIGTTFTVRLPVADGLAENGPKTG